MGFPWKKINFAHYSELVGGQRKLDSTNIVVTGYYRYAFMMDSSVGCRRKDFEFYTPFTHTHKATIFRILFILHHIYSQLDHLHFTHCQPDNMRIVNEIYMRLNECECDCNENASNGVDFFPIQQLHHKSRAMKIVVIDIIVPRYAFCVHIETSCRQFLKPKLGFCHR